MFFLHWTLHIVDCLSDASVKVLLKVVLRRVKAVLWMEHSLDGMRGHGERWSVLVVL